MEDIYLIDRDQLLFNADKASMVSCIEPLTRDYKKVLWHNLSKNKYRDVDIEGSDNMKILKENLVEHIETRLRELFFYKTIFGERILKVM